MNDALSGPVEALLDGANNGTWSSIRKLLRCEAESVVSGLSNALSGFDMDQETIMLKPFLLRPFLLSLNVLQLPGLISLSSKLLPTVMNILKRLTEEGQKTATNDPQGNAPISSKSFQNGVDTSPNMSSSASSGVTSSGNGSEYSSAAKEE